MYTILLVEDDGHIMRINSNVLSKAGYRVLQAATLSEAETALKIKKPDLIVLDVMLPDGNGVDWCRAVRGGGKEPPILFLSANNANADILDGLKSGGDDYLTKPYDLDILLARCEILLDKATRVPQTVKKGNLRLELPSQQAYLRGEDINLSSKEFALLLHFIQNEGMTLTTEAVYEKVWGQPMGADNRAVQRRISELRGKLIEGGCDHTINVVYGKGYCFEKI